MTAPATRAVAIAGVGYSPFTKASGRSVLDQALEACRNAVADAGLSAADVDLLVGTSTGSVLAAALSQAESPERQLSVLLTLAGAESVREVRVRGRVVHP